MNIIFVPYDDLSGPGVIHAYHFAWEIASMGNKVFFVMPGKIETLSAMERKPIFDVAKIIFDGPTLAIPLAGRIMDFRPDIIHAWTPRNIPARVALEARVRTGARIIVHHEDDEDFIYDCEFPKSRAFRLRYALKTLSLPGPAEPFPNLWAWRNPLITRLANSAATAFTALAPAIKKKLNGRWGKKTHLLYPGVDLERFTPRVRPAPLRERFGLSDKKLIIYSGSIGHYHDFDILLDAVAKVLKTDSRVCLLQIGRFAGTEAAVEDRIAKLGIRRHVILAGMMDHKDIPSYLAAGDILVHPGRNNDFNRYRLPSKIPEYLAMGKPSIITNAGIGAEFKDRVEVLKTYTDDPGELAERIVEMFRDESLRATLCANARSAAERMFNLRRNAERLQAIYEDTLRGALRRAAPSCGASK